MKKLIQFALCLLLIGLFNISDIYASNYINIEMGNNYKTYYKKGNYKFMIEYDENALKIVITNQNNKQSIIKGMNTSALTDGKKIYYSKAKGNSSDMYVRDLATNKDKKIGNFKQGKMSMMRIEGIIDNNLYFSLLKEESDGYSRKYLYSMNMISGKSKMVLKHSDNYKFSPKKIFFRDFTHSEQPMPIYYSDASGATKKQIAPSVISHNVIGNKLYYVSSKGTEQTLYETDFDLNNKKKVLEPFEANYVFDITDKYVYFADYNPETFLSNYYKINIQNGKIEKSDYNEVYK